MVLQKKKQIIVQKILRDDDFLPNLSISQQLKLMNQIENADSEKGVDALIKKAEKMERK